MINVFILNWNSVDDILCLLESIVKSKYTKYRIILIHNGTGDLEKLKQLFHIYSVDHEVHLIVNKENLGYAGGNNRGFEYLQEKKIDGDILILNPDITLQAETLTILVKAKAKTNAGAIMIRTYDELGKHLYDSVKLDGFNQTYHTSQRRICSSDYAAGSCLYLDRETINKIGLFDDTFFMYWEEVDLSLRIKRNGKTIVSVTDSFVVRKSNPSERSINAIYFSTRNSIYMYKKYERKKFLSLCVYLLKTILYAIKIVFVKKDGAALKGFIKGCWDGIKIINS